MKDDRVYLYLNADDLAYWREVIIALDVAQRRVREDPLTYRRAQIEWWDAIAKFIERYGLPAGKVWRIAPTTGLIFIDKTESASLDPFLASNRVDR